VSGSGGVQLVAVDAADLGEVTSAPSSGYVTDLADDDDDNTEPEYAFDVWFEYDSDTHVLTPAPLVFVVESTDGGHTAIEILDYYDDAGTSAVFDLHWKSL
jgi:hypothetical protein